jgi:hypothetical protein
MQTAQHLTANPQIPFYGTQHLTYHHRRATSGHTKRRREGQSPTRATAHRCQSTPDRDTAPTCLFSRTSH